MTGRRGGARAAGLLAGVLAVVAVAGCGGNAVRLSALTPTLAPLPSRTGADLHFGPLQAAAPPGAGTTTTAAATTPPPGGGDGRATVIGDSVASAIGETPEAQQTLKRGMRNVTLDLHACRRLSGWSCTIAGQTPTTALEAVQQHGDRLGSVLVVDVGYNDQASEYASALDQIVRAAKAHGVERVVWVTLREDGPAPDNYREENAEIRDAAKRWPELEIADWNSYSAGKPWFAPDGIHLGPDGGVALARFLRPYVTGAS